MEQDVRFKKILLLRYGYDSIGLVLNKINPGSVVHMIDRDALVIEYSHQNAEMNQLSGVEKSGSIGYDDVTRRDVDLILSNIPSWPRESAIACFLLDIVLHLRLAGLVAIVVVTSIYSIVERVLNSAQNTKLLFQKVSHGPKVFHHQFFNVCN